MGDSARSQRRVAPDPGGVSSSSDGCALAKLQLVLDRFEITIAEANDLVVLGDYDICIIGDDSSSMHLPAEPPERRTLGRRSRSRWDELKETIAEIVEIAVCFDENGVDVFF